MDPEPQGEARARIESIDIVRGLVMVLMVLDHVRDHLTDTPGDPASAEHPEVGLFIARWVTHYCAPTFVFLAGTSAYLFGRTRSKAELSRFLWTRGLWLVVLEFVVVRTAWTFSLAPQMGLVGQVIWAIGVSMIVLAVLVRLPLVVSAGFGLALIFGHDLFDGLDPADFGAWRPLVQVLHVSGRTSILGLPFMVAYPLVPWIGVMATGYAAGKIYDLEPEPRSRALLGLGAASVVAFVVVRTLNGYGDPTPWTSGDDAPETVMHWLAATKYPPSLAYLLMTLGPMLLALGALERWPQRHLRWLLVFGRVPLFLYVVHLYLAHTIAVILGWATGFPPGDFFTFCFGFPEGYGVSLPWVLFAWLAITAALYPACKWYGGVKRRSRSPIFSYL
ncbi:MAG: DUF1624 domain-containing protein [Sandaracinaceae bacterium]|nr:DUF1624 domain-containing protein [Sandaracinaceae bacterium]